MCVLLFLPFLFRVSLLPPECTDAVLVRFASFRGGGWNADYETDAIIQQSLRTELAGDVTVITVAHRLQTIMDSDKVVCGLPCSACSIERSKSTPQMVLDAGRLVEFDTPRALLQKEGGLLRALVDESADREALHAMAGAGGEMGV